MSPDATTIDLDVFTDPNAKVILLAEASHGDRDLLSALQVELKREESRGWCRILHMTDEIAVVRWLDQFVLTLSDAPAVIPNGGDDV